MSKALLKQKTGQGNYREFELNKPVITLGRSKSCDIVVNDSSISRLHTRIEDRHGQYFIVDNNSSNGTFLNRRKVGEAPLKDGDSFMVGRINFFFYKQEDVNDQMKTQTLPVANAPEWNQGLGATQAMRVQDTPAEPLPGWQDTQQRPSAPESSETAPNELSDTFSGPIYKPTGNIGVDEDTPHQPSPQVPPPTSGHGWGSPPPQPEIPQKPPPPPRHPTGPPLPGATPGPPQPAWQLPSMTSLPLEDIPVAAPAPRLEKAAPFQRLFAVIIDGFLAVGVMIPMIVALFLNAPLIGSLLSLLASIALLAHLLVGWHKYGKTLGKHLLGLRIIAVEDPNRRGLGAKTIFLRLVGYWLAGMTLYLLFLTIFSDKDGRGVHDKIAGTQVINDNS